jgi:hypothetical protein
MVSAEFLAAIATSSICQITVASTAYLYVNENDKQNILDIFVSFDDYKIKNLP